MRTKVTGAAGRVATHRLAALLAVAMLPEPAFLAARCAAAEPAGVERSFTAEERTNIAVYESVNRSVVNLNTRGAVAAGLFLIEVPAEGAGSGIVLDQRGHLLTNYHVVENAREIDVLLFDGSSHRARRHVGQPGRRPPSPRARGGCGEPRGKGPRER